MLNQYCNFNHLKKRLVATSYIYTLVILFIFLFFSFTKAEAESFNSNLILETKDLYSLPSSFSSPQQIQKFLSDRGSLLANYQVDIGLYRGGKCKNTSVGEVCYNKDSVAFASTFPGVPANLIPEKTLDPYTGKKMSVADFIWKLSRTNFGSGCSTAFLNELCYDNSVKPINPGFILAMIQKESRLVNGPCARPDADTNPSCEYSNPNSIDKTAFRLDRATGYYCFETQDKTKGCWDENPNWLAYKGFFRQVYHMVRRVRLLEKACEKGGKYSFKNSAGDFKVGSTVRINGTPAYLSNGITCALYVYTPNFSANELHWKIMKEFGALHDFKDEYNLPTDYKPKPIQSQKGVVLKPE